MGSDQLELMKWWLIVTRRSSLSSASRPQTIVRNMTTKNAKAVFRHAKSKSKSKYSRDQYDSYISCRYATCQVMAESVRGRTQIIAYSLRCRRWRCNQVTMYINAKRRYEYSISLMKKMALSSSWLDGGEPVARGIGEARLLRYFTAWQSGLRIDEHWKITLNTHEHSSRPGTSWDNQYVIDVATFVDSRTEVLTDQAKVLAVLGVKSLHSQQESMLKFTQGTQECLVSSVSGLRYLHRAITRWTNIVFLLVYLY